MERHARAETVRRLAVLAVPVAAPSSMWVLFSALARRMSSRAAYNTGFVVYWLGWCGLFPLWVLGWRRSLGLLAGGAPGHRGPNGCSSLCLWPVVPQHNSYHPEGH
ncbi:MAG: hypothetical protein WB239_09290 [Acidimicrobiia bacterium]